MTDTSMAITPVYFPFTFIPDNLLREIAPCWKEVVVYQPSEIMIPGSFQPWIDQGFLKVRIPLKDPADMKRLRHELQFFHAWGEMHQGVDVEYLKAAGTGAPYTSGMNSDIIADIRKRSGLSQATAEQDAEANPISARLFLHLAQDYDQRSREVKGDIQQFERNQDVLKEALHPSSDKDTLFDGLTGIDLSAMTRDEKPDAFMMQQRIRAWNHLFGIDGSDTDFLFTDSREALLLVLGEEYEKFEVLHHRSFSSFPFYALFAEAATGNWSEAMREKINSLTQEMHTTEGGTGLSLRCYVVPGQSSRSLLEKACSAKERLAQARPRSDGTTGNALFGLLEWEEEGR